MANLNAGYSLALLNDFVFTLDVLPLDTSRTFADLRELDAVLSSSISSVTSKIYNLIHMIENGKASKEERLWLLTELAEEAARLKPGGEDKIRVACTAADSLRNHVGHLRNLAEHIPEFDASLLDRQTTFPHVTSKIFVPPTILESGRRRRNQVPSLQLSVQQPSPGKRKRTGKEDDADRTPRKEKLVDARPRAGGRTKRYVHLKYSFIRPSTRA
jgi:inhibitor of growth protein 3